MVLCASYTKGPSPASYRCKCHQMLTHPSASAPAPPNLPAHPCPPPPSRAPPYTRAATGRLRSCGLRSPRRGPPVHHPLCDLTQVRVPGGPSFCHNACPHLLTFSAQNFDMSHVVDPGATRNRSTASAQRLATAIRAVSASAPDTPGPSRLIRPVPPARLALVHLQGRTQLDCPSWMSTAANATARQAPAARGRWGSPTPGAAALLPAWSPPLPPLLLLQSSPVTDHHPGSHAHAPSAHKPATPVHPRRQGLRSGGSTPPRRSPRLHGGGPAPLPRCITPPRATRPHSHPPLTGPWLNCPPPPSLPAPAPAPTPVLVLPLLPVEQPISLSAPSPGLSHRPALLPNPQLAVDSVRTGLGRGDVSRISFRPSAPPPSEGPLSPSATTPLATEAGEAAVGRGAAVGAARAT
jgi:hypothetical protein